VREAVGASVGARLRQLYVTPEAAERHADILAAALDAGVRAVTAHEDVVAAMSETRQPQGVIAVCDLVTRPLREVVEAAAHGAHPALLVVLDQVSDPGNAGTIIRSAHAMGAGGVVLTQGSVDPHNGKCVRSTAGSLFHIPIAVGAAPDEVAQACLDADLAVAVADAHASHDLGSRPDLLGGPLAWVFGSEAHGAAPEWQRVGGEPLKIPMTGGAESLNLAAAAAICLYATSRARATSGD
jgi:RNA methyltransferase, TrmH family